jgi:hypothetical protein
MRLSFAREHPSKVKKIKEEAPFRRGRASAKQVPELLEQVRDLLEFLPDLFRRAAAPAFLRF